MHTGKAYKLTEFLFWTRRNICWLLAIGSVPVILFHFLHLKWLTVPWPVVALLGTAASFLVGFKNVQTYNRTWEARKTWGATMSASRSWALICRDFIPDTDRARTMVYRHLAWLTALRYQLRAPKAWEHQSKSYNREYRKYYTVPESTVPFEQELRKFVSEDESRKILPATNRAFQILAIQGDALRKLRLDGLISEYEFLNMHAAFREFASHQGKSERIKNFPYPRQYATVNSLFIKLFCILLPFGLLAEFDKMNSMVSGALHGNMIWLVIPFSVLISWIFTSLNQVGESTENPYEGGSNDIPITQMSKTLEVDVREMLGETDLPPVPQPVNNIVL